MSEWISVKDKPLPARLVLGWFRGDFEFCMCIEGKNNVYLDSDWQPDRASKITHWMPLPDAPEVE